jgi:ATP-dependent RNA helicase RhlE
VERPAAPAVGVTHTVYPVPQELKSALLVELLGQPGTRSVLAFTRTKHRANRLAEYLTKHGVKADRIHGNRSQAQRTAALAGFKHGRFQVLVATDIAARGIDIDALSHVVNFDVPSVAEDYIHRVGRTARAQAVGDAFTLVSPGEEADLAAIERAIRTRFPRVRLPGFDYARRPADKLEIPLAERIAAIRTRRAGDRRRAHLNAERRAAPRAKPWPEKPVAIRRPSRPGTGPTIGRPSGVKASRPAQRRAMARPVSAGQTARAVSRLAVTLSSRISYRLAAWSVIRAGQPPPRR